MSDDEREDRADRVNRSHQRTTSPRTTSFSSSSSMTLANFLVVVLASIVLFFVIREVSPGLVSFPTFFSKKVEPAVYLPIVSEMPAPTCFPVSPEEIIELHNKPSWAEIVRSMEHHMTEGKMDGMSAFHIQSGGQCFMILRQEDGTLLHMFNPTFRGYSPKIKERVTEVSVACPTVSRVLDRAGSVVISYNDAYSGDLVMRQFGGQQSLDAQTMIMYLLGKTTCTLHQPNTDNGLATLKEMIANV